MRGEALDGIAVVETMANNQHVSYPDEEKGHKHAADTTEGGACLTGHEGDYRKVTCSYRWQAHEVSRESRRDVYDVTPRRTKRHATGVPTGAYWSEAENKHPEYYSFRIPFPQEGDWFLDGPLRDIKSRGRDTVKRGKNFTKDTWPYWHNGHHLIPKATFNDTINASEHGPKIRRALLKAEYNLNHKVNMVILPLDPEVGRLLKLPRHLILKEPGRVPNVADHDQYTDLVLDELQGIIDGYARLFDQAKGKKHKVPKPSLDKKKLERLSRRCFRTVRDFGRTNAGAPLDDVEELSN